MKKSLNKDTIIKYGFYGGLAIKAVDALIEFFSGLLLIVLSHDKLNQLIKIIAIPELKKDPTDILMNYLITIGQNFSISTQQTVAIYLLLHGTTKLVVIWLLLKKKLWAYPIAVIVFGFFIVYEVYNFSRNLSILLLLFIIVDVAMVVIVILEYKQLKVEKMR